MFLFSVLSYCQVHQISAVLYVAYTESMYVDSDAILVFKQVLKGTSFSGIIQVSFHDVVSAYGN